MRTYEELISDLRRCADGFCQQCDRVHTEEYLCSDALHREAANAIEELLKRKPQTTPENKETIKPPPGVKPYYIAIPQRIKELAEAIERYTTYDYKVSTETWAYEILCLLRVMEVMIKTTEKMKK